MAVYLFLAFALGFILRSRRTTPIRVERPPISWLLALDLTAGAYSVFNSKSHTINLNMRVDTEMEMTNKIKEGVLDTSRLEVLFEQIGRR